MLRLLRSRKLSVWEDVPLLREYIRLCGITQSECAARLGRSQSSVANRLRLLRLTDGERRAMEEAGLSERHARALLRLTDAAQRKAALRHFAEASERCGDGGLCGDASPPTGAPGARRPACGGAPSAGCGRLHGRGRDRIPRRAIRYAHFFANRNFSMILCFTRAGKCGRIIERMSAALSFRPPFSRYLAAREARIKKGSK